MTDHKEVDIPRTFFSDQAEAISFLVSGKEIGVASSDRKYVATLKKEDAGKWLYLLTNVKDELYVGDYVRPFRCNQENIDIFHSGVNRLADILLQLEATPIDQRAEYLSRGAEEPNVFGPLAPEDKEELTESSAEQNDGEKTGYFDNVIIREFLAEGIQILRTADGQRAFVSDNKHSNMVPEGVNPLSISLEDCQRLIEEAKELKRKLGLLVSDE